MTPSGLTRQQSKVLAYIRGYIAEHGCSPSYAEIAAGLNIVTRSAILRHVHALADKGRITLQARGARSIALTAVDALILHLPADITRRVQHLAGVAGVTPEDIVVEALRDSLFPLRVNRVSCETSDPLTCETSEPLTCYGQSSS